MASNKKSTHLVMDDVHTVTSEVQMGLLEKQLEALYARDQKMFEQRTTIKNWCVTVWLAVFAFVSTQRGSIDETIGSIFLLSPIVIFWLYEGMYGVITNLTVMQACEMEKRLAVGDFTFRNAADIFMLSKYSTFGNSLKAKMLFSRSGLLMNTIFPFYSFLLIISIGVSLLLF